MSYTGIIKYVYVSTRISISIHFNKYISIIKYNNNNHCYIQFTRIGQSIQIIINEVDIYV